MPAFWRNLSERERLFVKVGGAILAALAVMQLLIAPVMEWRTDARLRRDRAETLYAIVAEAAAQGRSATNTAGSATPVRDAVTMAASAAGVTLSFVNARPDGSLEASAGGDPAEIFNWVDALKRNFGVDVVATDIAREQGDPTQIRAQVTFHRSGGQ